jgi:threonine/homoserine/homoserine lactone efflux protein
LFPIFIDVSSLHVSDILTVISITAVGVGGVKVIYAFSAIRVVSLVKRYKLDRAARKTAGGLMVASGSYLIVKA